MTQLPEILNPLAAAVQLSFSSFSKSTCYPHPQLVRDCQAAQEKKAVLPKPESNFQDDLHAEAAMRTM